MDCSRCKRGSEGRRGEVRGRGGDREHMDRGVATGATGATGACYGWCMGGEVGGARRALLRDAPAKLRKRPNC